MYYDLLNPALLPGSTSRPKGSGLVSAAVTLLQPLLATFGHDARAEQVPLTPAQSPTARQSLNTKQNKQTNKTGSFKWLTVRGALLNGVEANEMLMWFYVGEIIAKRSITGYDV
uniref:Uncharacterized protein n=1 Tax=Sus scrofa TaxID=9823 RepID=A0A8D1HM04_PIG